MADVVKVDESTWRLEDGFVRFFLLVGEEKAALIDSGANCPEAKKLAETLTDKPILLINTHGDGDHVSGTGDFAEIHMHPSDYENCGVGVRFPQTALVAIGDGDEIELGDRLLKIIHIPGHTSGSVAILDVKNRVLYAGDSVQKGHIFMFGNKREPDRYEESLEKLIGLKDEYDVIYASHDEFRLPGDYAPKVKESWQKVRNGEASFETADLFGNKVKSYDLEYCGFYLE